MMPRESRRSPTAILFAISMLACGGESTTAPGPPDEIAPTVVSLQPTDGAEDVTIRTTISITFSEPVELTSVASPLRLLGNGYEVDGTVSFGNTKSVIVFRPARPLDLGVPYATSLSGSLTDEAGNPLGSDRTWTFTTTGDRPPAMGTSDLLAHIGILAHDSMMGRAAGTEHELKAAAYIRSEFQEYGLEPGAPDYFQTFQLPPSASSQNVIGVLPGAGVLADSWLIVGAHYDHVGVRETSPGVFEIHNGADDNASGTAMMLELARLLAGFVETGGTGGEDRRTVQFQAFGAEERGLIGSNYYCSNPTVPLSRSTAMFNFDMVGRLRNNELIVGGVSSSSAWPDLLVDYNRASLTLVAEDFCTSCSDHSCFQATGRPILWFFTGLHPEYHRPGDDPDLINAAGMARIGDLALETLIHMAVR